MTTASLRGHMALLALLVGLLAAVVWAGPAAAHNVLRSSTPADGVVLPVPPPEVELQFDESVVTLGTEVAVLGPGGAVELEPLGVEGAVVTQPLPAGLAAGDYTVQWRATSADGHPVSGELGFAATGPSATVPSPTEPSAGESTAPDPTATAAPAPAPSDEPTSQPDAEPGLPTSAWVVLGGGAVAALGGAALALRSRRLPPGDPVPGSGPPRNLHE